MKKLLIILLLLIGYSLSAQVSIIIRDSTFINTTADAGNLIDIAKTVPASLQFQYNHMESNQTGSNMLQVGTGLPSAYDNNLDGAIIEKSYFESTEWDGGNHMLMAGYNINYHIRYNKFLSPTLGIVLENNAGTRNTEGGLYFNVIKKGKTNAVINNGQNSFNIYNNTFYAPVHSPSYSSFLKIDTLNQVTPVGTSDTTRIKNNIFYAVGANTRMIAIADSCLTTLECDYNVYWNENSVDNEPTFVLIEAPYTVYSWADWQALGYDAHSVVSNPNFIDTINFIPSARVNGGVDLGTDYQEGLAVSAEWNAGLDVATETQGTTKQIGAHIYNDSVLAYSSDVYFVAPNGDNSDAGTITAPWLTWQYAFDNASAGDSVVFRDGTYPTSVTNGTGVIYDPDNSHGSDGTRAEPITFMNYPGETPILDGQNTATTPNVFNYGIYMDNLQFVNFKGLQVQNFNQLNDLASHPTAYDILIGIEVGANCGNLEFRNLVIHHIGGIGFRTSGTSGTDTITIVNSDSYSHCDTLHIDTPGSYGTGWSFSGVTDSVGTIIGDSLRAWMCSDQGVTNPYSADTYLNYVWSFNHNDATGGNGSGFKASANSGSLTSQSRLDSIYKEYNRCIAVFGGILTAGDGFTTNETGPNYNGYTYHLNNCLAWGMGRTGIRLRPNTENGGAAGERTLSNNIGYDNGISDYLLDGTVNTYVTNSWDTPPNITVTDAAWLETDSATIMTALMGDRQADGSLPDLGDVFQLASESVLIDVGTDVGYGNDIGPFQYEAQTPAVLPTVVTTQSLNIGKITAQAIGNNTDDGGGTISAKGTCWSTSANPDTGDSLTDEGAGAGSFTSSLTGLSEGVLYHIRAYATNEAGTAYGDDETFTTLTTVFMFNGGLVMFHNGLIIEF